MPLVCSGCGEERLDDWPGHLTFGDAYEGYRSYCAPCAIEEFAYWLAAEPLTLARIDALIERDKAMEAACLARAEQWHQIAMGRR